MNPNFDAILFDLDGTLADTAGDLIGAINALLIEEKKTPVEEANLRPYISRGSLGLIPMGFNIQQDDPDFESLKARFLQRYADAICVKTKLFDGITALLACLDQHMLPWGIVTNKARNLTVTLLDALDLSTVGCVVCGDDAVRNKPWPDTLLLAATQLKVDPAKCLYVGDFDRDIEAAIAAGMQSVAVTYGYADPDRPIETWGATFQIDHPRELLNIIWSDPIGCSVK